MISSIHEVVHSNLCISCGACLLAADEPAFQLSMVKSKGMELPDLRTLSAESSRGLALKVCPGRGYPIEELTEARKSEDDLYHLSLGYYRRSWAARMVDSDLLEKAASGGIMTGIALHLIESGRVDGAVVTRMRYGEDGPHAEPFIARTREELLEAQGSKYIPVPALEALKAVKDEGRYVFVGTPCQIAGLRLLQRERPEWKKRVPFTIGNFCGGFRDYRESQTLIKRESIRPDDVVNFQYRGGGQPGRMLIETGAGERRELPYPGYAKRTGYIKHYRCRMCVDGTAELADFSCGDAWIDRFLDRKEAWSLLLPRSQQADEVCLEMEREGKVRFEEVSEEEVIRSQRTNLQSKKTRQASRRKVYSLLVRQMPEFDGGYPAASGGMALELRVIISHSLFYFAEKLGLYPLLARLLGRMN